MAEARPLSRMRRAIAKSMTLSAAIPQFGIEMALDTAQLSQARAQLAPAERPSYTDALVASVAQALRTHPGINATFTDEGIVEHEDVNVALATALDGGLISPVIVNSDGRTIAELACERSRLVQAARAGTLRPDELLSATFTISNLGPFGVRRFTALVVPPQAAILAVGSMEADSLVFSLSADHRAIDGAPASRFLLQVKNQLEDADWIGRVFAGERPEPLQVHKDE